MLLCIDLNDRPEIKPSPTFLYLGFIDGQDLALFPFKYGAHQSKSLIPLPNCFWACWFKKAYIVLERCLLLELEKISICQMIIKRIKWILEN